MMIDIAGGIILAVVGLVAITFVLHVVASLAFITVATVRRWRVAFGVLWCAFLLMVFVRFIATHH